MREEIIPVEIDEISNFQCHRVKRKSQNNCFTFKNIYKAKRNYYPIILVIEKNF